MIRSKGELSAVGYETSKPEAYLRRYHDWFQTIRQEPIVLLELGVGKGGSLLMWRDYFPRGTIVGVDIRRVSLDGDFERIHLYRGRQDDGELLDEIGRDLAPDGFDIVIDDCAHIGDVARRSFWHLFLTHLKSGGMYIIEDWGTGYWRRWPDGRAFDAPDWLLASEPRPPGRQVDSRDPPSPAHAAGMVGFVKDLVDEAGMADITKPALGIAPHRESLIEILQICHGQVLVVKTSRASGPHGRA